MNKDRLAARVVGILFIVGTAAGVASVALTSSMLSGPDFLTKIVASPNQFILATLCVLVMGLSLAMIPIVIFPILKKFNETLALGYLIFRGSIEATVYLAMVFSWLFLLLISQNFTTGNSILQSLGDIFLNGNTSIGTMLIFVFGIGALMLYWILYQSKLVPRWLSVWGIIAIFLHLTTGVLILFNLQSSFSTANSLMNFPIFLQEMVMAVWLIWKGFSPTTLKEGSNS